MTNEETLSQFSIDKTNEYDVCDYYELIVEAMDAAREDEAGKWQAQLKQERERAGKLLELLNEINHSLYTGEDLKDGEVLDWYMRVIDTIKGEIETTINNYKNQ